MTRSSKPVLIQQMALGLEKRSAEWLADEVAKFELLSYEATKSESGHTKYSAPEGGYDDTVIARCLAFEARRRNPLATLSIHQQVELKMPATWRDAYINQQDPVLAQRLLAARYEEYSAAEAMIRKGRRPVTSASEVADEGTVADIW